jgi:uncharacterized protein
MVPRPARLAPLVAALLIVAAGVLMLWSLQRRLMYFPFGAVPPPHAVGLRAEEVTFTAADGVPLHGWFVPPIADRSGVTVVVFNGNAGHRAYRAPLASAFARAGLATLLFDYRGYGGNPGTPSETGLARDARAAVAFLEARDDVDPARIVYFGESLGTGVAVALAAERTPLALVLRSPFTSMVDVARHHYPYLPVRLLLRDRYPSIDRIAQIRCPLVVITAEHDSIVPAESSVQLYEAARQPKRLVVVRDADHNDAALVAGPLVVNAVRDIAGTPVVVPRPD